MWKSDTVPIPKCSAYSQDIKMPKAHWVFGTRTLPLGPEGYARQLSIWLGYTRPVPM